MSRALNWFYQCKRSLRKRGASRKEPRQQYSNATIVLLALWSKINNQTNKWALENFPGKLPPGGLPSEAQLSRRLRKDIVLQLLERMRCLLEGPTQDASVIVVDGHALPIARHSRDRDSSRGYGCGTVQRGYKIVLLATLGGRTVAWRVVPMGVHETEVAQEVIKGLPQRPGGLVLGDSLYNTNELFGVVAATGRQLLAWRQKPYTALGHRRHHPDRRLSIERLENRENRVWRQLYRLRSIIERCFAVMANVPELNPDLPTWIRGLKRVRLWTTLAMFLRALHRHPSPT